MADILHNADRPAIDTQATENPAATAPVEDMSRLVRLLAGRVHARLPRGCGIEMADLVQAGNIGLLQASRTYRPRSGTPLAGYAKFRIRGEMLDTVRRNAGLPLAQFTRGGEAGEDEVDLENTVSAP